MVKIFNDSEKVDWKMEIKFFNAKSIFKNIIIELKNNKTITIWLYNNLNALISENFSIKRGGVQPALFSFMKTCYSLQLDWEKRWFKWKLNELMQHYSEAEGLLYERLVLPWPLYDLIVNAPVVALYWMFILDMTNYLMRFKSWM